MDLSSNETQIDNKCIFCRIANKMSDENQTQILYEVKNQSFFHLI